MMLINAIYLFSVVNIIVSRDVQRAKYKDTISVSNSNTDCGGFNSIWGMDNTCTCGNFKAYTFMSAFPNGPPRCVYDYMGCQPTKVMTGSTITLTIPDSLRCHPRNVKVDKTFIWNIEEKNGNDEGIWTENVELKRNINVGKKLVISGIDVKIWSGQLLKIDFQCSSTSCFLVKVVGKVKYPFDINSLYPGITTTATTTTTTTTKQPSTTKNIPTKPSTTKKIVTTEKATTTEKITTAEKVATTREAATTTKSQPSTNKITDISKTTSKTTSVWSKRTTEPLFTYSTTISSSVANKSKQNDDSGWKNISIIMTTVAVLVSLLTIIIVVYVCRKRLRGKKDQTCNDVPMKIKSNHAPNNSNNYDHFEQDAYLCPVDMINQMKNNYNSKDLPNPIYKEIEHPSHYTGIPPTSTDVAYAELTNNRRETMLSTTSSTCGLITDTGDSYTPLGVQRSEPYTGLNSIHENYQPVGKVSDYIYAGLNKKNVHAEPVYREIEPDVPTDPVYQGVDNPNFHTENRKNLPLHNETAVNNDAYEYVAHKNDENFYHELAKP